MFALASSAAIGFFAKASCDIVPKISWRSNSFKLSFCISNFAPASQDGGSGQRPFVVVSCGDRKKKTEIGTWSQEKGEWQFREVITLEVSPEEEVTIQVSCAQQYNLLLAAVELSASLIGEVFFPVSSVLPKLREEDRDIDGIMHATPVMGFDLLDRGAKVGRIYVSMETSHLPSQRGTSGALGIADTCINAKALADKNQFAAGPGPSTREQMYSDRGSAERYSDRASSGGYPQPSRNSPWA